VKLKKRIIQSLLIYINDKRMFVPLFCLFLCIAVGFWYGLKTAVQRNLEYRIERDGQRIESALVDHLNKNADVLLFMKAYFQAQGIPAQKQFSPIVKNILVEKIGDDAQAIGFVPLVKKDKWPAFVKSHQWFFSKHHLTPSPNPSDERDVYAPFMMAEPVTPEREKLFGFDLYSDQKRSINFKKAVDSAQMQISQPLRSLPYPQDDAHIIFILSAPLYKGEKTPATVQERRAESQGIVYMPLGISHFFKTIFGESRNETERVNFSVEIQNDEGQFIPIYQRFDKSKNARNDILKLKDRTLDIYGRSWKIAVSPLPNFFTKTDLYLSKVVAFALALFGALLILIFNLTKYQLDNERKAKELIAEAAKVSQEKTERLKKLNQMNKSTPVQLGVSKLVSRFFDSSIQISQATHAFLYFESDKGEASPWAMHDLHGFRAEELIYDCIPSLPPPSASTETAPAMLSTRWNFLQQKYITKIDEFETSAVLSKLVVQPDRFVDWILIAIPSLVGALEKRCGLLFLGKTSGEMFSENDLEMIESIVYQAGIGIDNTKLFKKVEDSNKAKTAFLANMSHEVRTPLNAIIGFSEILAETKNPDQQRALLEVIQQNGAQLTSIIDDILDLSKIEAGKILVNIKPVKLNTLIDEVKVIMDMRAQYKNIEFVMEYRNALPASIDTDEVRLKQILMNLVGNAIKFTERGRVTLTIYSESESVAGQAQENLVFEIADTGIGIAPEAQERLFQAFSQGDASTTRRFGGTGLGLALSERLAQELGGSVYLETSERGKGSTFKVKIALLNRLEKQQSPAVPSQNKASLHLIDPDQKMKDLNVLLVEDSVDNQGIFTYFLKSVGAQVEIVDNGEDAVASAAKLKHDFILMDIQIPKIDGIEATRRIRALGYMHPIIALTAHAFPEEKMNCLRAGCNGLISKPVNKNQLITQILKLMEEEKNDDEHRHSI
jgi:signal transduction histidine kinase/CHASE1-domain containing sensor protein/ActR/RegA family two-component response regulator